MPMSKLAGLRYRELVVLYLQNRGVTGATARPERSSRLSAAILDDSELADVQGLGQWHLDTKNESVNRDYSGALDNARRRATLDGKKYAAVTFHRQNRQAEENFVLLTLGDFATLLADTGARP